MSLAQANTDVSERLAQTGKENYEPSSYPVQLWML